MHSVRRRSVVSISTFHNNQRMYMGIIHYHSLLEGPVQSLAVINFQGYRTRFRFS